MQTDFDHLRQLSLAASHILLTGPKDPDGDSVGACLALRSLLQQLGCSAVDVAGTLSFRYSWLPEAECCIPDANIHANYDMVIVLDGDKYRLSSNVEAAFSQASTKGIIDHHRSTNCDGYQIALVEPTATSTCSMIFALAQAWGCQLNTAIAVNLYAGLIFDTGGFRYQNTTTETLNMAAVLLQYNINHPLITARILAERRPEGAQLLAHVLTHMQFFNSGSIAVGHIRLADFERIGCIGEDIEGLVEQLLYITGVELSCLCIERSPQMVKISLRSRSKVNVAELAKQISPTGGGHIRAAGAPLHQPFDTAWPYIQKHILAAFVP